MSWVRVVLALLAASTAVFAGNPAAPVIAKVRRTVTHSPTFGPETNIEVEEGVFYRSSKGLTYQYLGEVRGVPPFRIGRLTDRATGKSFDVQLNRRRAVLRHRSCPEWPPRPPDPALILGEEIVNGIDCVILPVKCEGVDCGRMWRSKEHNFTVKTESAVSLPSGAKQNIVIEYYDIRVGEDPGADEIDFLDRFEVMDNIIPAPNCPE